MQGLFAFTRIWAHILLCIWYLYKEIGNLLFNFCNDTALNFSMNIAVIAVLEILSASRFYFWDNVKSAYQCSKRVIFAM